MISQQSIKSYENSIKKLRKLNIDVDNRPSIENMIIVFDKENIPHTTQMHYIVSLIWHYKQQSEIDEEYLKDLRCKMNELKTKIKSFYDENVLTKKEQQNYLSWDKIVDVYSDIKKDMNKSQSDYINFVILSMYILFPPRRILDFCQMKVVFGEYVIYDELQNTHDEFNYYIYDKSLWIFNNYKTMRIKKNGNIMYKQQHFTICQELNDILKNYIDVFNITGKMFDIKDKAFIVRLNKIFENACDKSISVDLLRHSYIMNIDFNKITEKQRKDIADKMGHSVNIQMVYRKIM